MFKPNGRAHRMLRLLADNGAMDQVTLRGLAVKSNTDPEWRVSWYVLDALRSQLLIRRNALHDMLYITTAGREALRDLEAGVGVPSGDDGRVTYRRVA
ncbi:MAG: hypothetical protein IOD05_16255 [Rhodobacter sp.]|jgi:hypothetical protein|nr:hypothetical protein [Rhodobacter sp.]